MFQFYNSDKLIRTIKKKTPEKAGFHRIYWGMDEKGPDRPSRKISKNKNERGGINVKPGTYKIKVSFGEMSDETMIEVKSDPRLNTSMASINEVYETSKKLNTFTQTAADAVKQLVESKNVASKYQKELKELDEKAFKDQIKASKDIVKQIDSVIAIYLGKEDKRQGITMAKDPSTISYLSKAVSYVGSLKSRPGRTEIQLIENANAKIDPVISRINEFYKTQWLEYRAKVEAADLSLFKDYDMLK